MARGSVRGGYACGGGGGPGSSAADHPGGQPAYDHRFQCLDTDGRDRTPKPLVTHSRHRAADPLAGWGGGDAAAALAATGGDAGSDRDCGRQEDEADDEAPHETVS